MSRDIGRAIAMASAQAAAETSAIRRGVVSELLEDGRLLVEQANGAKISVSLVSPLNVAPGVAMNFAKSGNRWEPLGISPWQGGRGAPFASP